MKPATARMISAVFLFCGLLVGFFDAPGYLSIFLSRVGLNFSVPAGFFPYQTGLDIKGGTHLVYQADLSSVATEEHGSSMEAVRDVIERRVNLFGVTEPIVQVEGSAGDRRLIVELAGVKNIGEALRLIGETPFLEFREERPKEEREALLKEQQNGGPRAGEDPFFVSTPLTGRHVRKASLDFDSTSFAPLVSLELSDEGAEIFAALTEKNVGKRLAIYLDGAPISVPEVREKISGGRAQITGNFTPEEARELVGRMNAGALPVPISLIAQQTVGATLGADSLDRTLRAGLLGFAAVALFMLFWYRFPGLLAVLALLLYVAMALAAFKLIPVTLTIAGITGFILSIGMAVDANILIFERMREEIRQGKNLEEAVSEGFVRAWTSIRDSNISSLITCFILYGFGTSVVRGFALTLAIGILISMFSAISVTRTLLLAVMSRRAFGMRFLFLSGLGR